MLPLRAAQGAGGGLCRQPLPKTPPCQRPSSSYHRAQGGGPSARIPPSAAQLPPPAAGRLRGRLAAAPNGAQWRYRALRPSALGLARLWRLSAAAGGSGGGASLFSGRCAVFSSVCFGGSRSLAGSWGPARAARRRRVRRGRCAGVLGRLRLRRGCVGPLGSRRLWRGVARLRLLRRGGVGVGPGGGVLVGVLGRRRALGGGGRCVSRLVGRRRSGGSVAGAPGGSARARRCAPAVSRSPSGAGSWLRLSPSGRSVRRGLRCRPVSRSSSSAAGGTARCCRLSGAAVGRRCSAVRSPAASCGSRPGRCSRRGRRRVARRAVVCPGVRRRGPGRPRAGRVVVRRCVGRCRAVGRGGVVAALGWVGGRSGHTSGFGSGHGPFSHMEIHTRTTKTITHW